MASTVKVAAGDSLTISGKWFHAGDVVYIRWDGVAVVGTVTGNEWRNAAIIGSSIASSSGYFQTTATIPTADAGEHYISVEDSQSKVIIKVMVLSASGQNPPTNRMPSILDLSCKSTTSYIGFKVEINGTLLSNGTAIPSAPVFISYSVSGGSTWTDLTSVYTGSDGAFLVTWMPPVSGNFLIKAKWNGNTACNGTSRTVSLSLVPFSEQTVFSVTSNSTVSALSFNSASNQLSFVVTGDTGTKGFVDVAIAKSLVPSISNLRVYLNGANQEYATTSTSDSWFIHFIYSHSTHNVLIDVGATVTSPNPTATPASPSPSTSSPTTTPTTTSTTVPPQQTPSPETTSTPSIPEFPSIAILIMAIAATSAIIFSMRKRRTNKTTR